MKDYKTMLAAAALGLSILIIGLFTVSVFNYIAFLKEQNHALLEDINSSITQLKKSITALQSKEKFEELVDLKNENISLKKETQSLRNELNDICKRQGIKSPACAKESVKGNCGFLLKGGTRR